MVYELRSPGAETAQIYYRDLKQASSRRIVAPPGDDAKLKNYFASGGQALFAEQGRDGTRVWLSDADASASRVVFETNTFLKDLAEGEVRRFEYRSLENETLHGWLILPVGYQPGRRYPMLTWVYQSAVHGSRPFVSHIASINPYNLQPLASKGYAVLFPAMPGATHEYHRLLNGVLPALDKAIEMGIADPDRLAVAGQSNGGYSTYGLISQTRRFKAAIAIAGMSELASLAMQFQGDYLGQEAIESSLTEGRFDFMESRMSFGLPWNSYKYERNSPISYVERVQTPLLQLHGDLDGATVQQAQYFFSAMQRLGKRARLVQYAMGDEHSWSRPPTCITPGSRCSTGWTNT